MGPAVIAGAILGFPAGWILRRKSERWGFVLMGISPFLLIMVAPAIYSDRVVVDQNHFEANYGLWFSPTIHNIRFQDLREIRYVGVPGRRGRMNYELRCTTTSGEQRVVHAGDLVKNTVPEILERAKARGVAVSIDVP
jgi:hypothetical protein